MSEKQWTEGVLDDGAVILCDGERVTISDVLARLSHAEYVEAERDALKAENAQLRDVLADRDMDREMAKRSKLELVETNRQLDALRARIEDAPFTTVNSRCKSQSTGNWHSGLHCDGLPIEWHGKRVALVMLE